MLLEFLQDMGDTLRLPVTFVIIEFIGTFAFAISGVRLSSTKHFDIFGAWIVGMATAIGGGTIRDLMLGVNPFWMTNGSYFVCCALAVLAVGMFGKYIIHHNYTWFIFDTIGLALFNVVGLEKALTFGHPYWVAITMGAVTGAGGGIIRDVLMNDVPLTKTTHPRAKGASFASLSSCCQLSVVRCQLMPRPSKSSTETSRRSP